MTENPIINAIAALLYICAIAFLLFNMPRIFGEEESILIPISMLSLFVFSAAAMGYVFCLTPLRLFLENKKKEAIHLFLATTGYFGLVTLLLFLVLYFLN